MNLWHGKLIYTYIGRDYEILKDKLKGEYYAIKLEKEYLPSLVSKLFPTIEELISAIDEYKKATFIYP